MICYRTLNDKQANIEMYPNLNVTSILTNICFFPELLTFRFTLKWPLKYLVTYTTTTTDTQNWSNFVQKTKRLRVCIESEENNI